MAALDGIVAGAGTVLSTDQVDRAVDAGAQFIVSPGLDPELVSYCLDMGVPTIPGIATASELQLAIKLGVHTVKFFPALHCGGAAAIKALSAPFPSARFVPMGGIAPDNITPYLTLPSLAAIGGSWMVKKDLIAAHQFDTIAALVADPVTLARSHTP